MNFELGTRDATFVRRGTRSQTLARKSLATRDYRGKTERFSVESLRGRLPRLQSTNSVGGRIPEREVLAPFSVHFLHHHTRDSLRKGTLRIKGTVNRAQVAKNSYKKTVVDGPNVNTFSVG